MSAQFKLKLYEWAEWAAKLVLIAIGGLLWQMNLDLQRSLQIQQQQDRRITSLETNLETVKQSYVTRAEILETVKRVEQNQEIMMLRWKAEATKGRP
jgi:hypothetical protein